MSNEYSSLSLVKKTALFKVSVIFYGQGRRFMPCSITEKKKINTHKKANKNPTKKRLLKQNDNFRQKRDI